jgi:hypothetical protein
MKVITMSVPDEGNNYMKVFDEGNNYMKLSDEGNNYENVIPSPGTLIVITFIRHSLIFYLHQALL